MQYVYKTKNKTRTYVSGTDIYPHMPILRPHDLTNGAHLYGNVCMRVGVARVLADSSDFRFLGEQSSLNGRFPALDADELPSKI